VARQEQDFNKETNRQYTALFIKDSARVTIDLTEVQCTQVLQSLLMFIELQGRLKPLDKGGGRTANFLSFLRRLTDAEMQDVEVNSLFQIKLGYFSERHQPVDAVCESERSKPHQDWVHSGFCEY
jgi:hypothetical protein